MNHEGKDPHLVLNRGDVAFVPPVQGAWSLQEVGLHEQGSLDLPLLLAIVAVHHLPELVVSLRRHDVKESVTQRLTTNDI